MAHEAALLLISFLVIIVGAELFTNGVEWLGVRLSLSEGAVGSVLAAVGTALPETLIPVVALVFFRDASSHDIALGAILGAPFMLATLAFFVTALAGWCYRSRRDCGARLQINRRIAARDLQYFVSLYAAAILVSFAPDGRWVRWPAAVCLVAAYAYYVYLNLRETAEGAKDEPLFFNLVWAALPLLVPRSGAQAHRERREQINGTPPRLRAVSSQVLVAMGLIIGGAYIFVDAVRAISTTLGFPALVVALVVAPVATELPEKLNSVIWMRQGRDTLALGNISGAMVFQSTIPVALGMMLTPWRFGGDPAGNAALLSAAIALLSALTVLATIRGGRAATVSSWALLAGLPLWLLFLAYVLVAVV